MFLPDGAWWQGVSAVVHHGSHLDKTPLWASGDQFTMNSSLLLSVCNNFSLTCSVVFYASANSCKWINITVWSWWGVLSPLLGLILVHSETGFILGFYGDSSIRQMKTHGHVTFLFPWLIPQWSPCIPEHCRSNPCILCQQMPVAQIYLWNTHKKNLKESFFSKEYFFWAF